MRTKGQALESKLIDSISQIENLMAISHSDDDYSMLVKSIGGEIEKFLKSVIFLGTQDNKDFYTLINNLDSLGLSQQERDYLHAFRQQYNNYKHNPDYSSSIIDCRMVFENARKSIRRLIVLGVGKVDEPYQQKTRRMVWLAGWDDYIGGMTEMGLFVPDFTVDFPFAVEHFNIDIKGWQPIIDKFTATGDLKMGKEFVSERAYSAWANESDFMGAGRFTGDITELIKEVSSHINQKKESDLLPFLKRQNDLSSVKAAIVFSLFDAFKADNWVMADDLIDEVALRASYDYGIHIESKYLHYYLSLLDKHVLNLCRNDFAKSVDIIWTNDQGYELVVNKHEISKDLSIAFNKEYKLITKIK